MYWRLGFQHSNLGKAQFYSLENNMRKEEKKDSRGRRSPWVPWQVRVDVTGGFGCHLLLGVTHTQRGLGTDPAGDELSCHSKAKESSESLMRSIWVSGPPRQPISQQGGSGAACDEATNFPSSFSTSSSSMPSFAADDLRIILQKPPHAWAPLHQGSE